MFARGSSYHDDCLSSWAQKAQTLVSALAHRAPGAEAERRIPEETLNDFRAAGFYRLLVPRAYGGEQALFSDLAAVVVELATGCASSAWVLSLYSLHSWLASLFPERAQQELFSDRGYSLIASPAGNGTAEPVEGGHRLSGRWTWASGVHHCEWLILNAVDEEKESSNRCFLIPTKEVEVIDCWRASGMCATGSDDVVTADIFVPGYRSLDSTSLVEGTTPGAALHNVDLYRIPVVTAHCLVAASTAVGIAMAAVGQYEDLLQEELLKDLGVQNILPESRMRLARAMVRVDSAWLLHRHALHCIESLDSHVNQLPARRARARMAATHVVAECRSVVREILDSCGARAHLVGSPLQRLARDIGVLSAHVLFNADATADLYGRVATGLSPQMPLL